MRAIVLIASSVLLCAACTAAQSTPTAPSPVLPTINQSPTNIPQPVSATYAISIDANGGAVFTDSPSWSSIAIVTASPANGQPPSQVSIDCGNGSATQNLAGFIGAQVVSCSFPKAGTYTVTGSVIAPNGLTTSGTTVVISSVRPAQPGPSPTPTPTLHLSVSCSPQAHGTATPCNVTASYNGQQATHSLSSVHWDLGNGDTTDTGTSPLLNYSGYHQAGTYIVVVTADYAGNDGTASTSVTIP